MSTAQTAGVRARLNRYVPILDWLPKYDRARLRPDLAAGFVVAALAVPQALGYAAIAGVPVELGLYAVPIALIAYAIFGSSRQLVVGPVSTVSVMSGSLVVALQPADAAEAILFTTAGAVWAGFVLIVAAQLRIGWVAEFLSKPIVTGFVMGLTLLVILGELPSLLGIHVGPRDVIGRIQGLIGGITDIDPLTIGISVVSLIILFVGSRLLPRVPWSLAVLVLGLVGSQVFDLAGYGVVVVGDVPSGLPLPSFPLLPLDRVVDIAFAGAALAFVGLAESLSAARLFAQRRNYRVRTDQELLATGAANLATGLTGGLAVAGSLSKTAALDRSGGRTQMAGVVAAVLALAALLLFAPALSVLPKAVLSAIVVHAVWGLIDIPAMRRYRHSRRVDFLSACAAVIGVLLAGPLLGLVIAIGWAILGLVYRSSRVTIDVMGKVPGEKAAWGSLENHPERITLPGVLVLRLNESLFWVNAARVKERVLELVDEHPDAKALVLDLESTDQLEITSADMLTTLLEKLRDQGIELYLVRVRFRVRRVLRSTGMRDLLGEDHLWHSITQGVRAARRDLKLRPKKDQPAVEVPAGPPAKDATEVSEEAPEGVTAAAVPEGVPAAAVPEGVPAAAVPEGVPAAAPPEEVAPVPTELEPVAAGELVSLDGKARLTSTGEGAVAVAEPLQEPSGGSPQVEQVPLPVRGDGAAAGARPTTPLLVEPLAPEPLPDDLAVNVEEDVLEDADDTEDVLAGTDEFEVVLAPSQEWEITADDELPPAKKKKKKKAKSKQHAKKKKHKHDKKH